MFGAEHLHHPVPQLSTTVAVLQYAAHISLCNPPHCRLELPAEHYAIVHLSLVLRRLLPLGDGDILPACLQRVLYQHRMLVFFYYIYKCGPEGRVFVNLR